jgi:NAD(P)-dependent dehydrogenase (short-subunit alcohol dehydrogenase family)
VILKNLTVCVTGTDRGIGLAMVRELLAAGNTVFSGGVGPRTEGHAVLEERYRGRFHHFGLDVGSDRSVGEAAAFIRERTASLDLLVNNAAILGETARTILEPLDFDEVLRVMNVTAIGAIRMTNALIDPVMRGGKIVVQISSEAGSISGCYREAWFGYCMAKAALNMGSAIVHNAIRSEGGRVLILHPGWVKTWMSGIWNPAGTYTPEESARFILRRIEERGDEIRDRPLFIAADTGNELPW